MLNYVTGSDVVTLLRLDKRSNNKVFLGCSDALPMRNRILLTRKKDTRSHGIYKQNYSSFCDTINMCMINLFIFSTLAPRVSWLFDKEEDAFLHIKKPTCPGNKVLYLVAA